MKYILLLLLSFTLIFAKDSQCEKRPFYSDRERGWFWKEICKKERKKKETVVKIPWDRLDSMSAEELKKLGEKVRAIAIMNPTPENVRQFLKLNIYFSKKASKFAGIASTIAMLDSEIASERGKIPTASFARFFERGVKLEERKERIRRNLNNFGLIVVVERTCPYCHKLAEIIKRDILPYGINVLFVERTERLRFANRLGVRMVPDTFLVWREGNKPHFFRIATGLVDSNTLLERIDFILQKIEEGKLHELNRLAGKSE